MTIAAGLAAAALGYPAHLGISAWRRKRRDRALAVAASDALFEAHFLPRSLVVHARDGSITLEGEVDQLPQAIAARDLVAAIPGVRSITNLVRMRADGSAGPKFP